MFEVVLTFDNSDGNEIRIVRHAYTNLPSRAQIEHDGAKVDEYTIDKVVADAVESLKAAARCAS